MSASVHRDLLAWLLKWYRKGVSVAGQVSFSEAFSTEVEFSDSFPLEAKFQESFSGEVEFLEVP